MVKVVGLRQRKRLEDYVSGKGGGGRTTSAENVGGLHKQKSWEDYISGKGGRTTSADCRWL